MRDSFKWHFQAQFLWEAYVIRHKCLHMFGHTISEMTPRPSDDVRGVNADLPESESCSLQSYPIRKGRCQPAEPSAHFPPSHADLRQFHCGACSYSHPHALVLPSHSCLSFACTAKVSLEKSTLYLKKD